MDIRIKLLLVLVYIHVLLASGQNQDWHPCGDKWDGITCTDSRITSMALNSNGFTGKIPPSIGNLTKLYWLDLADNKLSGPIPVSDGPTPGLDLLLSAKHFHFGKNQLSGPIPSQFFSSKMTLKHVLFEDNQLTGTIPLTLGLVQTLEVLRLDRNMLSGNVPSNINNLTPINQLMMQETQLQGEVPADLFSIPQIETVVLRNNQLNDTLDLGASYSNHLSLIDMRNNLISGFTQKQIHCRSHSSLMISFESNQLSVDSVSLSHPTKNSDDYLEVTLDIFPSDLSKRKHKSISIGVIIGVSVGGFVLVLLLVIAGIYAYHQKGRAERATIKNSPFASWDPDKGSGGRPQLKGARSFTFEELKACTNNFSAAANIGSGGYGMVYRGSLPNRELVAIKRAQHGSTQGGLEFKTEIELLSRVHHKNLVSLVGFCFDAGEQMLVYEYIVNGTLKDSLSGRKGIRLDWMRRLKITLGAARGLHYLHELADPRIIHRDVKSNNILLDERLNAKVSDFGLSKPLGEADQTHVTTQVKGTMGYMDPEYYMTQQLTEKSDVYSFGIVMLELITARNPIEKGKYIVRQVKEAMDTQKDLYNLREVLDPIMSLSSEQLQGLERVVDVALRCVKETGNRRPKMSEVVKEIENIMELVGMNPNAESTSTSESYEGKSKGNNHPYLTDFSYSGGLLASDLEAK
ncbi:hypothetical protein L1987_85716 [Smallanthus sonchifolius]|uniref:Uncharacterized protein n=1 Tax=Smallanthus sonchifolius TaxID=185202 RepID=A0ACB8XY40_9ASTR|nr:hypothetical protein L1987_85716 [Smallanthus sonchifolius]